MRRLILLLIILISISNLTAQSNSTKPEFVVGILTDGPWVRNNEVIELLKKEVNELMQGEFNVLFPKEKYTECNWDYETIVSSFNSMMNDDEVDLVIAYGEILSRVAVFSNNFPKPVIAPLAINAELQNMPINKGASGVPNLNYITFTSTLNKHVEKFKELYSFSNATLLLSGLYFNEIKASVMIPENFNIENVDITVLPIGKNIDVNNVVNSLPEKTDAIIAFPLLHLSEKTISDLYTKIQYNNIPVFTVFNEPTVNNQVLAGEVPKEFFKRLSRRIALNIQSILLGEDPGNLPVKFPIERNFIVNMKTALEFQIYPSWSLMANSKIINDKKTDIKRKLSLFDAISEAIEVNLDVKAKREATIAGDKNIGIAKANLFPQLTASANGVLIDKDRASASNGQQAQRTLSGSLVLSQLLYDEKAWTNLDLTELQQTILENERRQLELDIILEAATSYLNLLMSKSNESIQIDNFNKSLANLEIAQFRKDVGYAGAAEVYRWQSQIATNRKTVIEASAQRNIQEIDVNRILNRPLEERFRTEEGLLENLVDIISGSRIMKYYSNKWYFKIFRSFVVNEALSFSPELKIINTGILSQQRVLTSAKNSFLLPSIGIQAELNNTFYRGGAGSTITPVDIPGIGQISLAQPPKDLNWNVGINLSIPLFSGGARFSELSKAHHIVSQLEIEKRSVEQKIEQNVRSALHLSGASFAGMKEGKNAEEAAIKNLELAIDSYSRGAISITDLLDAQNAALIARQQASSIRYSFLIDMMKVQRSMGRIINFLSVEARNDFYQRLEEFFETEIEKI